MIEKRLRYKTRAYGFKVTCEDDVDKQGFEEINADKNTKILKCFSTKEQSMRQLEGTK